MGNSPNELIGSIKVLLHNRLFLKSPSIIISLYSTERFSRILLNKSIYTSLWGLYTLRTNILLLFFGIISIKRYLTSLPAFDSIFRAQLIPHLTKIATPPPLALLSIPFIIILLSERYNLKPGKL